MSTVAEHMAVSQSPAIKTSPPSTSVGSFIKNQKGEFTYRSLGGLNIGAGAISFADNYKRDDKAGMAVSGANVTTGVAFLR